VSRQAEFLTLEQAAKAAQAVDELAELIGIPYERWANDCHVVSLALLKTGRFGPGRVARGTAHGIGSQHSWIVLGWGVYDDEAVIVDPTYVPTLRQRGAEGADAMPDILVSHAWRLSNRPHGKGSIWAYGRPADPAGPVIELAPSFELSRLTRKFLEILGPLDRLGWMQLASGPMQEWPAGEILAAIADTPALGSTVPPIDHLGMLTSRNPDENYLNPADKEDWPQP
jgi:hypothetical protein